MYVEIVILALLLGTPRHGYEIKQMVDRVLGSIHLNNNQLYPALKRFEELGAITRAVVNQAGKPPRHVYHLTDRGLEILQQMLRDFPPEQAENDSEFKTRVSFFALLEPHERLQILDAREAVLQQRQRHLDVMEAEVGSEPDMRFSRQILLFTRSANQHEIDWIAQLRQEAHE